MSAHRFTAFEQAMLERVKVRAITRISAELLEASSIDTSCAEYFLSDQLAVALSTRVYQQDFGILERPSSLWQAFRQRWFPLRWLKRFPVQMERYTLSAIYPHFKPLSQPYGIRIEPVVEKDDDDD